MTAVELRGVSKIYRRHRGRPPGMTLKSYFLHDLWHRGDDRNVSKWALRDVNLRAEAGTTLGIIGRNGSGKSTLLKVISRILKADAGTVTVNGKVAALIELGAGFHPELTGRENAIINGVILGLSKAEIKAKLDAIIDFSELQEYIDDPVRTYSNGMYMRLGFSVAVHVDPEILLIDEILAVGDVAFKRKCMDRMNGLRKRGTTVVFVSHDVATVRSLCDEAAWLHEGVLKMSGRTADVVGAYLKEMR
jgi:lipopolysaccharide transport system ATP-binding protein